MTANSSISDTVLRRVRRIHLVRQIAPLGSVFGIFIVALWGIGREVWVAKVLANMPPIGDISIFAQFVVQTFLHTELLVQVLIIVVVATTLWLTVLIGKNLRTPPSFA